MLATLENSWETLDSLLLLRHRMLEKQASSLAKQVRRKARLARTVVMKESIGEMSASTLGKSLRSLS